MIDDNNDNQQTYDDHNKVRNEKEEMSNDDAHYNNKHEVDIKVIAQDFFGE